MVPVPLYLFFFILKELGHPMQFCGYLPRFHEIQGLSRRGLRSLQLLREFHMRGYVHSWQL